ncbi:DUF58 domain-containing protein [Alteromonas sp. ASW11-19]|uniref:DUF58 domain-containing protein n=1 Tax=Alteromonas salexigens TaxID=2982530 RepID=A0ABT2VKN6_9ALTE|nr:DUF58 domain-containing protein [Alteromonas salexigens]MCU7553848.1 DUF58 domain-containing protein [Alteromonas salexigens]
MTLRAHWQARTLRWLQQRIPPSRHYSLNLKSVFIFPSWFGWGYLLMCGCLFILGTNYQNNLMLLLCYFLLALMLITLFTSYQNFARLTIRATPVKPVYAGEPAMLALMVRTDADEKPVHGQIEVTWWQQPAPLTVDLDSHPPHFSLPYVTQTRGIIKLPRVTISSLFPLGLYRCWTHLDFQQTLTVYPRPIPCQVTLYPEDDEGSDTSSEQPGHDDFYALRGYQVGEPLQRIAWKNIAKGGDWVSKTFSQPQRQTGCLRMSGGEPVETALGKLAFQVIALSEQGAYFGLHLGHIKVPLGSGDAHKHQCLCALARFPGLGAVP